MVTNSADPETWDGDICYDNEEIDNGNGKFSDSSHPVLVQPLVKHETFLDDSDDIHTVVRTVPWSPAELVKLQEKCSRRSDESKTEYVWRVSLQEGIRFY